MEEEDDGGCFGDYECMGWNDYRACCSESFESCLMGFVMCSVICFSLIIIFFIFWIGSTAIDEADYQSVRWLKCAARRVVLRCVAWCDVM